MLKTHKHILVFFSILGILLVPVGNIMTIQGRFAKGDDSYIYLVDFDETAYDMYVQGYYPTDYTYADFRRDSIEGMVSHYVATDNNNFFAVVDTVENAVINDGWSSIKDFFENAWIDLKSGVVTVEQGFTDDFKHTLDGRFKITPSSDQLNINGHIWVAYPVLKYSTNTYRTVSYVIHWGGTNTQFLAYFTTVGNVAVMASWEPGQLIISRAYFTNGDFTGLGYGRYNYNGVYYQTGATGSNWIVDGVPSQYSSSADALADFYNNFEEPQTGPYWNGDGYYSDTPANYSINLPALPSVDWPSISNNNKTKYGVDFPDVDVSVDFTLPDMYYPKTVTYDVPYWLQNGDETVVDWQNISFDDVTLPSLEMEDGNGGFIQHLFTALPVGFSVFLLGVLICYLIFIML